MSARRAVRLLITLLVVAAFGVGGWYAYEQVITRMVKERCYFPVDGEEQPTTLTMEQAHNASIIVAASYRAGLPEQAAVIALATAWQESGLRNLDYGDRDSLGLFQQRPSYGWGTPEQIMDPWYSSGRFYEELVKFDNWEDRGITEMAQKVQRSGFPEAYRKHEPNAIALAGALRGSRPATLACVDRTTTPGDAAAFAEMVAEVPGVETAVDGDEVTITAPDETALWAATQLALANTRAAGVVAAELPGHVWRQGSSTWKAAPDRGSAGTATLRLRAG